MMFKVEHFKDLTAYRLGKFGKAPNLGVYFFSISNIYIDSAQSRMKRKFIKISKNYRPQYCLLTHYHEDHAGNAGILQKKFNTKIVAHRLSVKYLAKPFRMLPYEKIIWGKPKPFIPDMLYEDTFETDSLTFKIIHTPGHSEDSVCLHETQRGWLFSGDLFITSKPRYLRRDENIYIILDSLKTLSKIEFEVMFCSHRGILQNSPMDLIKAKIEYIEELIYKTKKLRKEGLNPAEIRDKLLGKEDAVSYFTGFDFCKLNLINSILKG